MSRKPKLRYGVDYYRYVTGVVVTHKTQADAHGASRELDNLVRNAAGRCAIENYRRAVIRDRFTGQRVRILTRTTGGITIKEVDN